MLGKDLSEAMGGIADEKIMDAMQAYEKKKGHGNLWFRVAAVAAMLAIVLTVTLWPRLFRCSNAASTEGCSTAETITC